MHQGLTLLYAFSEYELMPNLFFIGRINFHELNNWPAGPMARRLTTNQEIAGSIPASVRIFGFLPPNIHIFPNMKSCGSSGQAFFTDVAGLSCDWSVMPSISTTFNVIMKDDSVAVVM